jgi:hypothetical protein
LTTLDRTSFQRALDEAGRGARENGDNILGSVPRPKVRALVDFGPELGAGGEGRWGRAMDWTDELDARSPPATTKARATAQLSLDAEAIARELGVGVVGTEPELKRQWRAFVWRNHPDRQPADAREQAAARVAIANMLYDRARRTLKGRGDR